MQNSQKLESNIKENLKEASAVRVSGFDNARYWFNYVSLAHRGKLSYSASRDAVYEDGFFNSKYNKYCEKINSDIANQKKPEPIELLAVSLEELNPSAAALLMKAQVPFVIRGGAEGLGIMDWDLDMLDKTIGDCEVPINEAKVQPSIDYDKPSKAHLYYDFRQGLVSEVTTGIRQGNSVACVSASENALYHSNSRLRQDIGIERWEGLTGWSNKQHVEGKKRRSYAGKVITSQFLLQPGGAYTLWHMEPGDNFLVLGKGRKTWEVAHPKYTAAFRPRVKVNTQYVGSNIDFRESDEMQLRRGFNGYINIPKIRFELEAGDVMRVPNYWWHTASTCNRDYAVSAAVRSVSQFNFIAPGATTLGLLDPQVRESIKSIRSEGRIYDRHIGHPRKSRSQQG